MRAVTPKIQLIYLRHTKNKFPKLSVNVNEVYNENQKILENKFIHFKKYPNIIQPPLFVDTWDQPIPIILIATILMWNHISKLVW